MIKGKFLGYNCNVKKLLFLTTILFISAISHAAVSGPPSGNPILNSSQYQKNSVMNIDTATIRTVNISTFTTVPNFTYGIKINTTTYTAYGVLAGSRYLLYTLTSGMDCSGRTNGGKLTSTGSDIFCSDDLGSGGGGGSALGVYQDSVQKSSPTAQLNFVSSSGLSVTVPAAGTATITLNGNSTNYIRNSNTLLAGSTAYVQYLYVASTASISNLLSAGSMTVTNLSANKLVATDGNNKFWSKGSISLSTEVAGVLDWPNLTPNATSYIRNSTAIQNDSKFIVNNATFTDNLFISTKTSNLNLYTYRSTLGFENGVIAHRAASPNEGALIIGKVDRNLQSSYGISISSSSSSQFVSVGKRSLSNEGGLGGEYFNSTFIMDDRNNHILFGSTNAVHGGTIGDWGPPFSPIVNIIKSDTLDIGRPILSLGYEHYDGLNYQLGDSFIFDTDQALFYAPLQIKDGNSVKFNDTDSSNYVSFESSGTIPYNQKYILPNSTGAVSSVLSIGNTRPDGKIETKWASVSGSASLPAGSVQYESSGTFAGSSKFLFDASIGSSTLKSTFQAGKILIRSTDIANADYYQKTETTVYFPAFHQLSPINRGTLGEVQDIAEFFHSENINHDSGESGKFFIIASTLPVFSDFIYVDNRPSAYIQLDPGMTASEGSEVLPSLTMGVTGDDYSRIIVSRNSINMVAGATFFGVSQSSTSFSSALDMSVKLDKKFSFYNTAGTSYAAFKSSDTTYTSTTWNLPPGDALGCWQSNGAGNLIIAPCGGGGASSLGVFLNSVVVSSPTSQINFKSPLIATIGGTSTATITVDVASVTLQGNSFNAANKLLQLSGSALVPNTLIDISSITKQGTLLAGSNITLTPGAGTLTITSTGGGGGSGGYAMEPATVTIQANSGIYSLCASTSNERFGYLSLNSCTGIASNNASFGSNSLIVMTTGSFNSSFGSLALFSLKGGNSNSSLGYKSLFSNVSGNRNTAIGQQSLEAYTGSDSVAIGWQSLNALTTGNGVSVGANSLKSATTSVGNSALGSNSLTSATGSSNTAVGDGALGFYTTINANTGVGYSALFGSSGDNNVGIGFNAGTPTTSLPSISSSTFIGYQARQGANNLTNATAIGASSVVSSSNSIVLGFPGVKTGISIPSPLATLHVNGDAIVESTFTLRTSTVMINGTTYYWKAGTGSSGQYLMTDGATIPTLTFTTPAGGGGASSLGVFNNSVQVSSPTSQINFKSPFIATIGGSSTATITVDVSSFTLQSNTFNTANKLVQLSVSALIPNSLIDVSSITKQGVITAASGITLSTGTGTLSVGLSTTALTQSLTYIIDGGGSTLTTGSKGFIEIPFGCTIQQVTLLAKESGSVVIDLKKCTYSGYPTTSSIVASAPPTISSAQKSQDATLTGWTTTLSAGDILEYSVTSATTITRVTISLKVTK